MMLFIHDMLDALRQFNSESCPQVFLDAPFRGCDGCGHGVRRSLVRHSYESGNPTFTFQNGPSGDQFPK